MKKYVNLGCGPIFVDSMEWINLDFAPISKSVKKANLLGRLPLRDNSASVVYSSHFLEHVPQVAVPRFLGECYRVLEPGGVIRLVLQDLENMAREYLNMRANGFDAKANFLVLELIDQSVRVDPGGQMGRLFRSLRDNPKTDCTDMANYIKKRVGEDVLQPEKVVPNGGLLRNMPAKSLWFMEKLWILALFRILPAAFRTQNVSLAGVGERHHWLWDFHQLKAALEEAGFSLVERQSAGMSYLNNFPFNALDIDSDGSTRKGDSSMFVEAIKMDSRH